MDPFQQQALQQHYTHIFAAMMPFFVLFGLLIVAIYIIPLWRICTKAGLAGPLSLIALIPVVGKIVTLYIIAFSDWRVVPIAPGYAPGAPMYPPAQYPQATPAAYPPAGPPTPL